MTIESEITRIQNNIAAAYTAASGKGATLPATENSDNLATCIGSISGGASPTGLKVNVTFEGGTTWDNVDVLDISLDGAYASIKEVGAYLPVILNVPSNSTINYAASPGGKDPVDIIPLAGSITLQGDYAELNFIVRPTS